MTACGDARLRATLQTAAVEKAVAEAPTKLPEPPEYCTTEMPTVTPKLDEPVWGTQKRWEIVHDNETDRDKWCWKVWYPSVVNHAAGVPQPPR